MTQHQVTFVGDLPAGVGLEDVRPKWHAFGILVAWSGANIVALQCYILEFAYSLDASKLAIVATWLLYLAYLAIHARASLFRSNPWNLLCAPSLITVWGLTAPLLLWGMCKDLHMMRGFSAVEAMIVSCVNIFLGALSLAGVVAQNALFISVASTEVWARTPPTGIGTLMSHLMVTALNLVLGTSASCLLSLAHNRQTTVSNLSTSSSAAAAAAVAAPTPAPSTAAPAEGHADTPVTADAQAAAHSQLKAGTPAFANTQEFAHTQPTVAPKRETKETEGQGHRPGPTPFAGMAHLGFQSSPSLKPSAYSAPFSWTPALLKMQGLNASLIAWVQRAELGLLAAVPQEEAKLIAGVLSAMFLGTRFLTCVANYSVPGIVAMSPTMDMLAIVLGMMMGGSPDMQGWAAAQIRAYWSVRGLLRSIMPAHVADALEAYETERDHARPRHLFGGPPSTGIQGQPPSYRRRSSYCGLVGASPGQPPGCNRRRSYTGLVGAFQGQPSSCNRMASCASSLEPCQEQPTSRSRRASFTALVGLTKLQPGPSQPSKGSRRSLSGNMRGFFPSVLQSSNAQSSSVLESTTLLDSENKFGLERRRSFSERHEQVTVLFADIVGFTTLSDQLHPSEVMTLLCDLYREYDERAVELGLYTVDVIGDCYMCAANLIKPLPNHVDVMVGFAQDIIAIANATISPLGTTLSIRVGIHTGPLMSGVIGVHRLKFTLLGDAVNVASRMETTAIPNTIQISEDAFKQLQHEQPATFSKAARRQSLDGGGCGTFPDMFGRERGACSMVRGNSSPSLLACVPDGAGHTKLEYLMSSSTVDAWHSSMAQNSLAEQQEQQQHEQALQCQEQRQKQAQEEQRLRQRQYCQGQQNQSQGHHSWQQQQQQQQQQRSYIQHWIQRKEDHSKLHEPESPGKDFSWIQGAVMPPCTAEQSSHVQQPVRQDGGPAHPKRSWIERKLNVKGKGIMNAYTYIGQ